LIIHPFVNLNSSVYNKEMQESNLLTIFLTGLFAGGVTCMAVQGGLLTAALAQQAKDRISVRPLIIFLSVKLAAYTLLGVALGWLGSLLQLSLTVQIALQFAVVIFMIGTALNLLNAHPIFRYFVIQPPRFLSRIVRKQSKRHDIFAPGLLGAFTIFIPCGTTQAMMALAVASGSPVTGAMILFTFILATSPIFFLVGYFATKLAGGLQQSFVKAAALAIILLALFNANNTLALTGSKFTAEALTANAWCVISYCTPIASAAEPVSTADVLIEESGYTPNSLTVKAGSKVTLNLRNKGGNGCTQAFTIPSLGVQKIVPNGRVASLTFTAPDKPTQLAFMCSMGMYRGTINVI
jgi:sulfite exporter TauE/SafE